jgi:hypothetical protein
MNGTRGQYFSLPVLLGLILTEAPSGAVLSFPVLWLQNEVWLLRPRNLNLSSTQFNALKTQDSHARTSLKTQDINSAQSRDKHSQRGQVRGL